MKMNLTLALAAAFIVGPIAFEPIFAAVAPEAPAKEEAPAKPKKKLPKKELYRQKTAEALKVADANDQPIIAFLLVKDNPLSQFIEKKVMNQKLFKKDLAAKNFVLMSITMEKSKDGKTVDLKRLKDPEEKFIQNFGLDDKAAKQAKAQNRPEIKVDAIQNYPAVIGVSSNGQKLLFRMARYDADGGFGVWLSQVADQLRAANIEPVISPAVQKLLDNPIDESKSSKKKD